MGVNYSIIPSERIDIGDVFDSLVDAGIVQPFCRRQLDGRDVNGVALTVICNGASITLTVPWDALSHEPASKHVYTTQDLVADLVARNGIQARVGKVVYSFSLPMIRRIEEVQLGNLH